jgi:DNA-binding IscR family transcriptional regulator
MVDDAHQTAPLASSEGLWLSFSEIAARKGVSKQAIAKRAAKLIAAGLVQTKSGKGNAVLINLAQYDTAVGEVGNAAKEAGAETTAWAQPGKSAREPQQPRFRDAQTREKEYSADLKLIELDRLRGNLLWVADFDEEAEESARRIVEVVQELISHDDELTEVAMKEGRNGMRIALKRIVRDMRIGIVNTMKDFAAGVSTRAHAQGGTSARPKTETGERE